MLVLSRKINESILIDNDIRVTILEVRGGMVRLGIEAPPEIGILREELVEPRVDLESKPFSPKPKKASRGFGIREFGVMQDVDHTYGN